MKIDKKTLDETTKCSQNFNCLEDANHPCLTYEVQHCIGEKVLFIDCPDYLCAYNMNFGNSLICNCPTRRKIYNKYKK